MLTRADEYPYHQIAGTFSTVASSDKNWNDGHYICLCDDAGEVALIASLRLYQNNDVLDGFIAIRHRGKQYNIRVSRRLRSDMDFFGVGPLRMEFLEPLKKIKLVLEDNEYGISCEITCTTVLTPYEDPVHVQRVDGILFSERAVYEIVGTCEGHITIADKQIQLSNARSTCFRNHSWGFMPGRGIPRGHGAPPLKPPSMVGLRNWVLFNMPDHGGFYTFQENKVGERQSTEAKILFADSDLDVLRVKHDLNFYEGSTRLKGGHFSLLDENHRERVYEVEDMGWIYCQGGGYFGGFNDSLGQGVWRGENHIEGEVWDTSHPVRVVTTEGQERVFQHAWAESFVRLKSEGEVGFAHFESVTFGSYEPYGLVGEKKT
ncbi:MAG: hypothetical protein HOC23_02640 [Halieaceae bacterium]|jgi:hypothetical protein|nr:hypothetical protein [Halieaceae bacterium]